METRRDDVLIDGALRLLGSTFFDAGCHDLPAAAAPPVSKKDKTPMIVNADKDVQAPNPAQLACEARRVLRRLSETGAVLAVAADMEKAVVVRDGPAGQSTRTAVVDRPIAQAMALQDWIAPPKTGKSPGRIVRYAITPAGRSALGRLLAEEENAARAKSESGFAEAQSPFADQHRVWSEKTVASEDGGRPRRIRYNVAESPLAGLARRRDKGGARFLSDEMVAAGERLREDFELAQMGPRVAQNWDRFLTGGGSRGAYDSGTGPASGPSGARERVALALADLGPGLSDVVLRCCCFLEGLEAAEKRMGWSARSGKIVLRIALQRLARHYAEGPGAAQARMIG